jgi:predicted lipid-binding transport protein (Tim44 family)
MGEDLDLFTIIFFAMIAAVILLRLRNVLGRRTGHERRRDTAFEKGAVEDSGDTVVHLDEREAPEPGDDFSDVTDDTLAAGFAQIGAADRSFTRDSFMEGARSAFEYIVQAYAAGDVKALRSLLADDVYRPFSRAITERGEADETLETVLVSMDGAEIVEAGMNRRDAFVTVRFTSHQINVTRDADGNVTDGNPHDSLEIIDLWTFEHDTRSRDPNWKLVATRSLN